MYKTNGGSNYLTSFPIAVTSTISFFGWFGEVRSTENTIEGDHGKSFASAACKPRQPPYLHPGIPLLVLLGVLVLKKKGGVFLCGI